MSEFVLSLFPGMDLLGYAFEGEGFCVVTGPEIMFGRDIRCFHPPPNKFDGIIGGPPCQAFSKLAGMVAHNHAKNPDKYRPAENLIPEFERCVAEATPTWFLMENVPQAPDPCVDGYFVSSFILNNRWFGEIQNRERKFNFGHRQQLLNLTKYMDFALFESIDYEYAVLASGTRPQQIRFNGKGKPKKLNKNSASKRSVRESLLLQGLPETFLDDSPLTAGGKQRLVGNGVPVPTGRELARAIKCALAEVGSLP